MLLTVVYSYVLKPFVNKNSLDDWLASVGPIAWDVRHLDLFKAVPALTSSETSIQVFSDEWEQRQEQCKSVILARAGRFEKTLGARVCNIRELSRVTAKEFLDAYHVQGSNNLALVYFGLFEKEELLGVLSLGRHSRQIAQNRVVLDRLCFKAGVQVVGGASKLLKRAVKWATACRYDELISFSDNCWTPGSIYHTLGFTLEVAYKPDYFYVKDGVRFSKQSQRKRVSGCPESMTELEWSRARGLTRVYDAGKKRWVLNLNPGQHVTRGETFSKKCAEQHQKGDFRHAHIRGFFKSEKNQTSVYFGSSYELRCLYLLEGDVEVKAFRRCDTFKGVEGWRNPDLWVERTDGVAEILEVKPMAMLSHPAVQAQLADSSKFANSRGVSFRVWAEKDSGLGGEHEIIDWAKKYLAETTGDTTQLERTAQMRRQIRRRYYQRHIENDKVTVRCDYCDEEHTPLRLTYDKNIARNGTYVCEHYGGHLAGQKPKLSLRKENPYAIEGKKQCNTCELVLEFARFDVRKASRDGLCGGCKSCASKKNKKKYQEKKAATQSQGVPQ